MRTPLHTHILNSESGGEAWTMERDSSKQKKKREEEERRGGEKEERREEEEEGRRRGEGGREEDSSSIFLDAPPKWANDYLIKQPRISLPGNSYEPQTQ